MTARRRTAAELKADERRLMNDASTGAAAARRGEKPTEKQRKAIRSIAKGDRG